MSNAKTIIYEYLKDPKVSEIMINGYAQVFVEREGKLLLTDKSFAGNDELLDIANEILRKSGKSVDANTPFADAILDDGSRINVIIPPVSLLGPMLTIRKFVLKKIKADDLIAKQSLSRKMLDFLAICVRSRKNIIISGGTGTGKTTILNALSEYIGSDERIITIEDTAELVLSQKHVGRLESKPADASGCGAVSIRQLLINALRMRPDRIIIGECRSDETLDMLQAMNTGHAGSLTTVHSNSPRDCLRRIETMVQMSGMPIPAVREQIASSINIILQLSRFSDGTRKITQICEVGGMEGQVIVLAPIYRFNQQGTNPDNLAVVGNFEPTGTVPYFIEYERKKGIEIDMALFMPDVC